MNKRKLDRAINLYHYIEYLKGNLECIKHYENNKITSSFEIILWRDNDAGIDHKIKLEYYTNSKEQLKNDIINMIKIDLIRDIQQAEKEFKEL